MTQGLGKSFGVEAGDGSGASMTGADGNFPSPIRIRIYGNEVYLQDTIGYDDTN